MTRERKVKITHRYPNIVQLIGLIEQFKDLGSTKNSGMKSFCMIFNPSVEREMWDLYTPVIAFGRSAKELQAADRNDSLVHVTGRLAMVTDVEGPRMRVIAHAVVALDEGNEELDER